MKVNMNVKKYTIWGLSLLLQVIIFSVTQIVKVYGAFYHYPADISALVGISLYAAASMIAMKAEKDFFHWRHYIAFWVLIAMLGLFAPHADMDEAIAYGILGIMPLLLISAIWYIKRHWSIKV
ncbi:hypothetical protein D7B12_18120 [Salmonella enterica]|nr:hypothetical protein [Salmonella enterica]